MPHLSDSQVTTYLQCPAKWKAQKIDKITGDESRDALVLGDAFHHALEQDGMRKKRTQRTGLTQAEIVRDFRLRLQENIRADKSGKLALVQPTLEARGEAMIAAYCTSVAKDFWPIETERPFDFVIPGTPLDDNGEPWTFMGRVDARTYRKDGTYVIVDWKTASKPWKAGLEHDKLQATAYLYADLMQGRPLACQVTFVTFPTKWDKKKQQWECVVDKRVTTRTLAQVGEYATLLRRVVHEIMEIKREKRLAELHPGWLCPWCPLFSTCRTGLEWHVSRGRTVPVTQYPDGELIVAQEVQRRNKMSVDTLEDMGFGSDDTALTDMGFADDDDVPSFANPEKTA